MKSTIFFFLLTIIIPSSIYCQTEFAKDQEAFFKNAMAQINPRHINWIKTNAPIINEKNMTEPEVETMTSQYSGMKNMQNADIEAMVFLVMMQASKSAQEDLKAIMASVKSINKQKEDLRSLISTMQQQKPLTSVHLDSFKLLSARTNYIQIKRNPDTLKLPRTATFKKQPSKAEVDLLVNKMKQDFDSMSELGEEQQLKMQMYMDRQSKMMTILSNLMKKFSDTQNSIIQNLK